MAADARRAPGATDPTARGGLSAIDPDRCGASQRHVDGRAVRQRPRSTERVNVASPADPGFVPLRRYGATLERQLDRAPRHHPPDGIGNDDRPTFTRDPGLTVDEGSASRKRDDEATILSFTHDLRAGVPRGIDGERIAYLPEQPGERARPRKTRSPSTVTPGGTPVAGFPGIGVTRSARARPVPRAVTPLWPNVAVQSTSSLYLALHAVGLAELGDAAVGDRAPGDRALALGLGGGGVGEVAGAIDGAVEGLDLLGAGAA